MVDGQRVWDCDSYKSPGPDGDIMRFLSEFHRNGRLAKGINSTFIALIPKVVGSVVSEVQSAFVAERQILDGILVAIEEVDDARRHRKELVLFKVDFEKAYDLVDWGYLDDVMRQMAFSVLWRKWIKECVSTATAFVLALNVMMRSLVQTKLFTGYSIGTGSPIDISHLQFADDTLLLGVKSWANICALRGILVLFESVSGLKVNFHKSMLVGVNVAESWLAEAATVLGCSVGKVPFIYLILLIGGDPCRVSFWEPVLNRIRSRLTIWKSRFLSFGGLLILLKSVLTSLPVYALSFFKASSGFGMARELRRVRGGLRKALSGRMRTVAEMSALGWGGGGEAWLWRRQLWAWEEEMVEECMALLSDVVLQVNVTDYWVWWHDPSGGYSERGAYDLFTSRGGQAVVATTDFIWHKQVPLRFPWRLGGYFVIGYQLKTIWSGVISSPKVLIFAWLAVGHRKLLNICTYPVLYSHHYGVSLEIGLASLQLIRPKYMTTSFSLRILQEALLSDVLLCNYCGCVA
ncbi:hypothetical protein TSUD_135290 [Trifolium subterraneum]|uniref:Reverse transcriptase domain-containing protein n=1 Tax=Trifolium subterraneum TaxID=3900 RepID=A0A2Z6PSR1_TRISU|nr:hypothetical protein TSUD_135290 [Trifolium subterraneum]